MTRYTLITICLLVFVSLSSCSNDHNIPYIKFTVNGKTVWGSNIKYEYTEDMGQYLVFTSKDINFRLLAPQPFKGATLNSLFLTYSDTSTSLYYEGIAFINGSYLEVTERDWEAYTMSGTFRFHAYDEDTHTYIDIKNGEFINVVAGPIPANN